MNIKDLLLYPHEISNYNYYNIKIYDKDLKLLNNSVFTNITFNNKFNLTDNDKISINFTYYDDKLIAKYTDENGHLIDGYASNGITKNYNGSKDRKKLEERVEYYKQRYEETSLKAYYDEFKKAEQKLYDFNHQWIFDPPEPEEYGDYLWGSTVLSKELTWQPNYNASQESGLVEIVGTATWGTEPPPEVPIRVGIFTDPLKKSLDSLSGYIYGKVFSEMGLVGKGGLYSRIKIKRTIDSYCKRCTDILTVSVFLKIKLAAIPLEAFTKSSLLGLVSNGYNGANIKYPFTYELSSYPINGGLKPPAQITLYFNTLSTDKPTDGVYKGREVTKKDKKTKKFPWIDNVDGPWLGYPKHKYIGDITYKTKKISNQTTGKTETITELNELGQRIPNWKEMNGAKISGTIGFIKSKSLGNFSGQNIENLEKCGNLSGVKIGVGDGTRKIFYHCFASDDVRAISGYYLKGNTWTYSINTTYTNENMSLSTEDFIIYNGRILEQGKDYAKNQPLKANNGDLVAVHPHPFTDDMYSMDFMPGLTSPIIGINSFLVYARDLPIKSLWVGGCTQGGGPYNSIGIIKVKAASPQELLDIVNNYIPRGIPSDRYEIRGRGANTPSIEPTITNWAIQNADYTLIQVGSGFDWYICDVGGFTLSHYYKTAIRFSTNETIKGYIEFDEAPGVGVPVFLNVELNKPFLYSPYNYLKIKAHMILGSQANPQGGDGYNGWENKRLSNL